MKDIAIKHSAKLVGQVLLQQVKNLFGLREIVYIIWGFSMTLITSLLEQVDRKSRCWPRAEVFAVHMEIGLMAKFSKA